MSAYLSNFLHKKSSCLPPEPERLMPVERRGTDGSLNSWNGIYERMCGDSRSAWRKDRYEERIRESQKGTEERQDHFSRCFKTPTRIDLGGETRRLLASGEHEKQEEDSSRFKHTIWATKLFCRVCGDNFGHRVLRREGYRDQTWMCRSRSGNKNKGCRCCNDYIYDYQLTLFLIKAAKHLIHKYGSVRTVRDISFL